MAGIVDYNPSYIAIAIELLSTVTGLEGVENFTPLWVFVEKPQELDTVTIKKAQQLFWQSLVIKLFQEQGSEKI